MVRMMGGAVWSPLESIIAKIMFINFLIDKLIPSYIRKYIEMYGQKFVNSLNPYIHVCFDEFKGEHLRSNQAFLAIRHYLREKSCATAKRLNADVVTGSRSPVLSMDYNQEVTDEFQGVKVWWRSRKVVAPQNRGFTSFPAEVRSYRLTFNNRDRELIIESYINHVVEGGKAIQARDRKRKLYSNNPIDGRPSGNKWSHVTFQHPATFDTLAMEAEKKEDIKNDLLKFIKGKEYYAKIGKAWKRGYLLYGPPGTGKSTMIAAMANLLNYDVYDLELTGVKDNTELKRLLIDTSNKSIIVIEDIDCSLDLTGQRDKKKRKEEQEKKKEEGEGDSVLVPKMAKEEGTKLSNVTLSGLLNFIDGLWSACGEERVIVFTTNHVNKLDPALIRRGRMDKHIEMSYCCFEAFKFLAKNYLDVESHALFEEISGLLKDVSISPADVAENLMPKSDKDDADVCLKNLIGALKTSKEQARKKAKEEARTKVEKEVKSKKEEEQGLDANKEEKEEEVAHLKAEKEAKEREEERLKAEKEEKEKEERLKAEKEEKAKEEAHQKAEKEGKGNEDARLKAEIVERKAKNSLLKRMLKKMKNPRKNQARTRL